MKSTEDKIAEKRRTLQDVNTTLEMSLQLYQITTSEYGRLYEENKAKVEGQHITGIATLLSRINDLLKTRNEIENEINALLELDEAGQTNPNEVKGSKAEILKLMDGLKKVK